LRGAEEAVEDVAETETAAAEARGAAHVVALALLRVAQHVVGVGHELETFGGLIRGIHIRMQFAREAAVGLLDLLGGCGALDPEDLVMICQRSSNQFSSPSRRDR